MRPFIAEECADLGLNQLLPRLRAALAAGDRTALVLWQRYAGKRWDDDGAALQAGRPVRQTREERNAFKELLDQLQTAVSDPKAGETRERLIREIVTARAVQRYAREAMSRIDGSAERERAALARRYGVSM